MFGILRQVQGWIKIKGATDGTMTGNLTDSLKVLVGIQGTRFVPTIPDTGTLPGVPYIDPDKQLKIRGDILTDEGTFRDDFTGGTLSNQRWNPLSSGNSSISVANSFCTLNSGTGSSNRVQIVSPGDYGPISMRTQFSLSQRIAGQTVSVGFMDSPSAVAMGAYFQFTGTNNAMVDCISQSSSASADKQTTSANIPYGNSSLSNDYYVEMQPDFVTFFINGIQVAQHRLHIPGPYDDVNACAIILNSGAILATTLVLDYVYFINQNSIQFTNSFEGDPLVIKQKSNITQTYRAVITGLVSSSLATDIFTLTGCANKTIKIWGCDVAATQTTAGNANIHFLRRSSVNTLGTSTSPIATPLDSNNGVAQATPRAYTANPTVGTLVGLLHSFKMFIPTSSTIGSPLSSRFGEWGQPIVLKSANEVFAVNLNGVTLSGSTFNIMLEWTEE